MTLFFHIPFEDFRSFYDGIEGNSLEKLLVLLDYLDKFKQGGENHPLYAIMGRSSTELNDRRQSEDITRPTIFIDSRNGPCGYRPEPEAKDQYTMYTIFFEDIKDNLGKIPNGIFDSIIFDRSTAYFCDRSEIKTFCDHCLKSSGQMIFDYMAHQSTVFFFRCVNGEMSFFDPRGQPMARPRILDNFDIDPEKGTMSLKEEKGLEYLTEISPSLSPGAGVALFNMMNVPDAIKVLRPDIRDIYEQWLPLFFDGYNVEWSKYSYGDFTRLLLQSIFEDMEDGTVKRNVRVWHSSVNPNPELKFFFNEAMTSAERCEYFMTKQVPLERMEEVLGRIRDDETLRNRFNSYEDIKEPFEYETTYLKVLCQLHHDYPVVTITKR